MFQEEKIKAARPRVHARFLILGKIISKINNFLNRMPNSTQCSEELYVSPFLQHNATQKRSF
jgi:hypothetical protein